MRMLLCSGLILLSQLGYGAEKPALTNVRMVYFLPMAGGLDQYLANRLTTDGNFQVVTDPQKAEVLFTDSIGDAFQRKFDELYPPPPKEEDEDSDDDSKADKKKDEGWGSSSQTRGASFSRGRGTVFMVDRQTRNVIWSLYEPVKGTQPENVERRARNIADRLKQDVRRQEKMMAKAGKDAPAPKPVQSESATPAQAPEAKSAPAATPEKPAATPLTPKPPQPAPASATPAKPPAE